MQNDFDEHSVTPNSLPLSDVHVPVNLIWSDSDDFSEEEEDDNIIDLEEQAVGTPQSKL